MLQSCSTFVLATKWSISRVRNEHINAVDKQLSYRREIARRTSYLDLQNCEVEFFSHPLGDLGGKVGALSMPVGKRVIDFL